MSKKSEKYLVLWGEAPEYEYQDTFFDKESAIQKVAEVRAFKVENSSEHWAELYQYVGGFQ